MVAGADGGTDARPNAESSEEAKLSAGKLKIRRLGSFNSLAHLKEIKMRLKFKCWELNQS